MYSLNLYFRTMIFEIKMENVQFENIFELFIFLFIRCMYEQNLKWQFSFKR